MGQPVVHFEVIGKDGEKLRSYYSELFGWEIDADNPMNYGIVAREENLAGRSRQSAAASRPAPRATRATSRSTSASRTSRRRSTRPRASAARASSAPRRSWTRLILGQFKDPEGHLIGLVSGTT